MQGLRNAINRILALLDKTNVTVGIPVTVLYVPFLSKRLQPNSFGIMGTVALIMNRFVPAGLFQRI